MPSTGPLFLARAVYRRRRMRDAARLLPMVGLLLVLLPGLRQSGSASDAIYLFVVWAVLIGGAAALAPGLSRAEADTAPESDPAELALTEAALADQLSPKAALLVPDPSKGEG